jgi:hypothetical protein
MKHFVNGFLRAIVPPDVLVSHSLTGNGNRAEHALPEELITVILGKTSFNLFINKKNWFLLYTTAVQPPKLEGESPR